jgi:hypothetical protein
VAVVVEGTEQVEVVLAVTGLLLDLLLELEQLLE